MDTTDFPNGLTRRKFLGGVLAAPIAAALLAACGDDPESAAGDAPASTGTPQPWTFTDGRGKTITLPKRPERIVAQVTAAASLWEYGVKPMAVFGPWKNTDGTNNIEIGNVDLKTVESVGVAHGEIDLEKLAALKPDQIVTLYYSGDAVWYVVPEVMSKVEAIAPIAAIKVQDVPISQPIGKFAELSGLLGADLKSKANADAIGGFEKAASELKPPIASKPGLKVMVVAPGKDTLSVANPKVATDLIWFKDELKMDIVQPPVTTFWESLSWEAANKHPADLTLHDSRTSTLQPSQLGDKPTWQALPAVQAGQLAPWPWKTYSHIGYTKALNDLTAVFKRMRTDVVA